MGKHSYRDDVALLFRARPREWIDGMILAQLGGVYAWRSRISDCRTELGMAIENRQRVIREHAADCPAIQAWDIEGACRCQRSRKRIVSEYRYLPPVESLIELMEAS